MFISYPSMFLKRNTSIKGQKIVGEVVKQLGVENGETGGEGIGGGFQDGSGSSSKQNGLVRVRCRDLHNDWPDDALPIVQMKGGFGSGNDKGTTDEFKHLAPVGSKVYLEFENNSQYHPVYHGGSGTEDKKIEEFTGKNYGHTYGRADPGGHLQKTNTKEGEEDYTRTHPTGTNHNMDKDGNYNVNAVKGHTVGAESHAVTTDKDHKIDAGGDAAWKIKQALNIDAGGDSTIKVGGKLRIEAGSIEFVHGGATTSIPITLKPGSPSKPSSPGTRTKPAKRQRPQYKTPGQKI